jgi:Tol biopolymer transport system component/DNA-binding winged helix-turn-helix (wHTH) protein
MSGNSYKFGKFQIDLQEKILRQNGESFSLPPKVLDVLCILVEKEGKIVTKTELMETVWADSFVEESNLTQSIYSLRRVLGTDEKGKNIIETIPRRGYRFAAPLQKVFENESSEKNNDSLISAPNEISVDQQTTETEINQTNLPVVQRYKKLILALAFGTILLLFTAFAANYFYLSKSANSSPLENVGFEKLTFSGDVLFPIISPDGKSFAFVREDSIFLQDVETGSNLKLNIIGHKNFGNLQFSVGGETIFFRNEERSDAGGEVFQVSRFGGEARKIAENVWSNVGFSPDGKQMSFVRFLPNPGEWTLIIKNLESGEERKILSRNVPYSIYRSGFPAWSSDGQKIVIVEQTPNQTNISKLLIVLTETGETEIIETPRFVQIEQTAWLPDGDGLLIVGRENNRFFQLWKMSYPSGELQKITNDLSIYRNLSISADSKRMLARQQSIYSHIWTTSADDLENQKQVTFGNLSRDGNVGLFWTNDANSIIYASRITGNVDLWSVNLSDGARRQLTENAGNNNENPFVTSDGKYIFFESTRSGTRHIWRIDINGENPTQITSSEKETDYFPTVSSDGAWLYFTRISPKGNSIMRKSLSGDKIETLTEPGKLSPNNFLSLSPDGNFLAFNNVAEKPKENSGQAVLQIGVISTQEKSAQKIFGIAATTAKIKWSIAGKSLEYIENSPESGKILSKNIEDDSPPQIILTLPKTHIFDFIRSTDGKNLAIARGKQESDVMLLENF